MMKIKVLFLAVGMFFFTCFLDVHADSSNDVGIIQNLDDVNEDLIERFEESYKLIPENVRTHFENSGWGIYAIKNLGQKKYDKKISILALTIVDEKAIYIDNREKAVNSVIHEIGHYIDFSYGFISQSAEFNEIFNEEMPVFIKLHKTNKANTNTPVEYFAEFFEVMMIEPELVMTKCPKTFGFIETCVENL